MLTTMLLLLRAENQQEKEWYQLLHNVAHIMPKYCQCQHHQYNMAAAKYHRHNEKSPVIQCIATSHC
uniref:Uncharacterized protein n=1 Tax=Glossina palpalis gambiensis TaxID=67801 RepID=A0A1B0BKA6_9MUSC